MTPTHRWKHLIEGRLSEAAEVFGAVPCVHGLIVGGGSLGRDEPISDNDLLPVYVPVPSIDAVLDRQLSNPFSGDQSSARDAARAVTPMTRTRRPRVWPARLSA